MDFLYALYDKVADRYTHFMVAQNSAMYVRELVAHRVSFPMTFEDTQPVCLGSLTDILDKFKPIDVSWTSWKSPESSSELLAPLGLTPAETEAICSKKIKEFTDGREDIPQDLIKRSIGVDS